MSDLAKNANAWPFKEAQRLLKRVENSPPEKGFVLFETGYGSSGLPHIGTFGEVARTTMVRKAFEQISDIPTKLYCFADDMDGLRKVPDNIPNRDMIAKHLGKPVTSVPDPFGEAKSFGDYNNIKMRAFLDQFGFDYEFLSSTECYSSGRFDDALVRVLEVYDKILGVILPTLGEERRQTYSPFLPICPKTGVVLQVPLKAHDAKARTITFDDSEGEEQTVSVKGGTCKLQWKVDWAMRWYAFNVDYEMSGKDLMESVKLSSIICRIMGSPPPEGFIYELFLDEKGEKISKSKGNGITLEEWLRYASTESLSLYMFQNPTRAKKLYFDVIPKAADEYFTFIEKYKDQDEAARLENPVYHIHGEHVPDFEMPVTFALLINLVGTAGSDDKKLLWRFISRYEPRVSIETHPELDRLIDFAIAYYKDFIAPTKNMRKPTDQEKQALLDLAEGLAKLPDDARADDYQTLVFDIGKKYEYENLREWFQALYEILFGQPQGPRMGTFIKLFGKQEMRDLIKKITA